MISIILRTDLIKLVGGISKTNAMKMGLKDVLGAKINLNARHHFVDNIRFHEFVEDPVDVQSMITLILKRSDGAWKELCKWRPVVRCLSSAAKGLAFLWQTPEATEHK